METCGIDFNSFGHICGRKRGHSGPHQADDETYYRSRPILVGRWPKFTWFQERLAYVRMNEILNESHQARARGEMQ